MKPRSPVLGYNHNVRYAARTWHVQTEDSGVHAPHVYTHLFHEGTILSSKKSHYDPSVEVAAVQKMMQTQHKLMLRELKSGVYDDKIEKIYGPIVRETGERADSASDQSDPNLPSVSAEASAPAVLEPAPIATHAADRGSAIAPAKVPGPPPAAPPRPRSSEDDRATVPNLETLVPPPPSQPATSSSSARQRQASLTPARPAVAVSARAGAPPTIGARSASALPRSAPPTIGSGRSGVAQGAKSPASEHVIVGRPTVIVGKDGGKKGDAADFWKSNERRQPDPSFGGDLISEKSLDEVILAYLSEDAPKK